VIDQQTGTDRAGQARHRPRGFSVRRSWWFVIFNVVALSVFLGFQLATPSNVSHHRKLATSSKNVTIEYYGEVCFKSVELKSRPDSRDSKGPIDFPVPTGYFEFVSYKKFEPLKRRLDNCGPWAWPTFCQVFEDRELDSTKYAREFGIDPIRYTALQVAENSFHSNFDDLQNSIGTTGGPVSGGLKSRYETTVGCAQMAVETAMSILRALKEHNERLYKRLTIPEEYDPNEPSEEFKDWMLMMLASDNQFSMRMQAAYVYVNTSKLFNKTPYTIDEWVRICYNPTNTKLQDRYAGVRDALIDYNPWFVGRIASESM